MVPELLGFRREVVRIHTDAVATDQAGIEFEKIPFRTRRVEHVTRADAEEVADLRDLVHERNVEVSLRVLDGLRRLRNLDRRRKMNARFDDGAIEFGQRFK